MTNKVKKAIEQLERISNSLASIGETVDYTDIAIKALEQEPYEDCISRQAVFQIIENKLNPCTDMFKCLEMSEIKEDVEHLPSVIPQTDVLDKIRDEIEEVQTYDGIYIDRAYVLQIIDKYRKEGEE